MVDKQPHEMSADDYHATQVGKPTKDFLGRSGRIGDYPHHKRNSEQIHKHYVTQALAGGLKVSPKALASHPDMKEHLEGVVKRHKEAIDSKQHPSGKKMTRKEIANLTAVHANFGSALENFNKQTNQHTEETESLRFEEIVNQGPLAQFGAVQFSNNMDLEPHKDIIGNHEHPDKDFSYEIKKAPYAKGHLSVKFSSSGTGYKHDGHHIADHLNARYSGREDAYIMSPSKAKKLHHYVQNRFRGGISGIKPPSEEDVMKHGYKPMSQHSESDLGEQDIEELVHPTLRRE